MKSFSKCTSLEEVIFEDISTLISVNFDSFDNCPKLNELQFPPSINKHYHLPSRLGSVYPGYEIFENQIECIVFIKK